MMGTMRLCVNISVSTFVTWRLSLPLWADETLSPDVTPVLLPLRHDHGSEGMGKSAAGGNVQPFSGTLRDPHHRSPRAAGRRASRKLPWESSSLTDFQNLPSHFAGFHFTLESLNA